jgi:hypothetical protein
MPRQGCAPGGQAGPGNPLTDESITKTLPGREPPASHRFGSEAEGEAVRRLDQLMQVAGLERRVAGIGHDAQIRLREDPILRSGKLRRLAEMPGRRRGHESGTLSHEAQYPNMHQHS